MYSLCWFKSNQLFTVGNTVFILHIKGVATAVAIDRRLKLFKSPLAVVLEVRIVWHCEIRVGWDQALFAFTSSKTDDKDSYHAH